MTCPFASGSGLARAIALAASKANVEAEGDASTELGTSSSPTASNKVDSSPRQSHKKQLLVKKSDSINISDSGLYYRDYLGLKTLLNSQHPVSAEHNDMQHDEMLFIITHQAYELWFKQILHELTSIHTIFSEPVVSSNSLHLVVSRLKRIRVIQTVLLQQMDILDTMTPMAFLEFRDYLVPASGFQSVQFRIIEVLLGIPIETRKYGTENFLLGVLDEGDRKLLTEWGKKESLLVLIDRWLSRIPFFDDVEGESWPESYREATTKMLNSDEVIIRETLAGRDPTLLEEELKALNGTRKNFESLFNIQLHDELVRRGARKISQKATLAATFIFLYRDQPLLSIPFQFLQALIDVDEGFSLWRHRHAALAHRQLGTKMGTGGTSGAEYLAKAAHENRSFRDLSNVSSFLVPVSSLPVLSETMVHNLGLVSEVSMEQNAFC